MPHPDIYTDWRAAKGAAGVLANAIGAILGQTDKGKPRVYFGRTQRDFPTWLAAWTWLQRVRADQVAEENRRAAKPIPTGTIVGYLPDK